ncbi:shikimate kinase [Antarcticibacterium arcticum]|uniref:Shikimate kinase n=1 Tax=Antarcticibacterium arcticum TaxID=2585771 RepID=A0A5B8YGV3_9FLAO|nr:shikimate kinase [Antarcticibacterium arcticum]QED36338.1 shikimate kinase [Antarcticibacterium arcticum]
MKIFLAGYMGSGKSLVGKHLSNLLSYQFIDLDDQIALMQGKSIPEIFDLRGELFFRKLETKVLKETLEDPNPLIISLGGGTPCYGNNLEIIKNDRDSRIIYLKASIGLLTERLYTEKEMRPVISHLVKKEDLEDFIRKHLFERSHYYLQAHQIINVEGKNPDAIAAEVVENLP